MAFADLAVVPAPQQLRSSSNRSLTARTSRVQDAFLNRLSKENPVRNHLDMRHRLDKDGKRYGKVIDYRYALSDLACAESPHAP